MQRSTRVLAIGLALVGLAVSTALAIDYLGPAPAYCAEGGCATVRASTWSHPLGIPTPLLGAGFFATMLVLLAIAPRATRVRRVVAVGGAAIAIALIALQGAVIGAWCKLCLIVDTSAIALAVVTVAGAIDAGIKRRGAVAIAAFGLAAAGAPIAIAVIAPAAPPVKTVTTTAAVPDVIAHDQVAGAVTIVEFIDFECPYCRALSARLATAVEKCGRPVRIVRKMVPIAAHAHAMPAAIAWCGAEAQGKGEAMAEALLAADPDTLTPEGCEQIAAKLGLDLARYRATCAAPETTARIAADRAAAKSLGVKYLPTLMIGKTTFSGAAATEDELVAAIKGA